MRKLTSIILIFALLPVLCTAALASGHVDSRDVTARYEKTQTEEPIYYVDIDWNDLTFTYSETTAKIWQPNTHTYKSTTTGGWNRTEGIIRVTNHSNTAVRISMSVTPVDGTGVDVSLTVGNATLAAGEVGNVDGAASVTGTITVSGKPNSTVTEDGIKVASITVTISLPLPLGEVSPKGAERVKIYKNPLSHGLRRASSPKGRAKGDIPTL